MATSAQPHPTVPFGQPGQVGFDGRAPGAPAPAAPAPAAPAAPAPQGPPINQPFSPPAAPAAPAAPHPTAPFGQPGYAAPGAPAAPAPAGQPSGVDANQVIQAGPGVPPELVGRTVGQAFQIYSALATEWIRRTPQGGGTQAPPPAPGQPAPAQPNQPGAQPPAGQPAQGGDFWRDPQGNIARIVREQVQQQLAPVTQATQEQEVIRARDIAVAGIPDVHQLWPTIVATLQGVDPAGLTDPRIWERAADMARGQLMKTGQYRPVAAPAPNGAPPAPNNQPYTQAGGRPNIPGGMPGAAVLPQVAFFTESPSTPGAGGPYNPGLTAEEANVAQKFGMSPQDYAAWKGGVSRGR